MCLQVAVECDAMTSFPIRIPDIKPQLSMDLWVVGTVNKRHDTSSHVKTMQKYTGFNWTNKVWNVQAAKTIPDRVVSHDYQLQH